MKHAVWIALLLATSVPAARAAEDLEDAPPLVKEEPGAKKPTPTPTPTATPTPEDEEPAPPPKPTRVAPPVSTEAPAEEPVVESPATPEPTDETPPKPVEELKDAPPLVPSSGTTSWLGPAKPLFGNGDASLLQVSSRLDIGFLAGGSVQQGFTLPSVRLTAAGSTGESIHYRLSLGETREFSSAQLPQVTPVEGFVELRQGGEARAPLLAWRLGMFTPEYTPWWTPDLSYVALPDYHEIDRTLYLSRDLGLQLTVRPLGEKLKISAGVFNGSGILTLNTNSSRAFTGNLELDLSGRGATGFAVGGSVYRVQQATAGSVNYRMNTIGTLYARLDLLYRKLSLAGEVTGGQLIDSLSAFSPFGAAGTIDLRLWKWGRFFTRAEGLQGSGIGNGLLHHYQLGPVFELSRGVEAWLLYDYLDGISAGSPQQQVYLRLRLSV